MNALYQKFDVAEALKMKVLLFNKGCYGKSPYLFSDISALSSDGGWVDLNYDENEAGLDEHSVISAADYVFGYNNRVIVQSTLDGEGEAGISDSNHIYNIKSIKARLIADASSNTATLEFRFDTSDLGMA